VVLGALVVVLVTPVNVSAAPGDLDPTFGTGGKVTTDFAGQFDQAFAMAIQGDGKIVAGGRAANPARGSDPDFALARYNLGGSLDTAFGTGGKVVTDFNLGPDVVASVAIQADGKIVAAGIVAPGHTGTEFGLARYNPDGTLDPTFGTGGRVVTDFQGSNDGALAVAIQTDGRIVAAGAATIGPRFDFALARYNPDGTLDPTFGTGGKVATNFSGLNCNDQASGLVVQSDGMIVAAGVGTPADGNLCASFTDFALARYTPNGNLDPSFGPGGTVVTDFATKDDGASDVALQADGRIVAAGVADTRPPGGSPEDDFALARYNPDGTLDPTFGTGGKVLTGFGSSGDAASSVAIQADDRIVAAGVAVVSGSFDFALARYNPDGTLDPAFGSDGKVTTDSSFEFASAVAIQAEGRIVAAGATGGGQLADFALARYLDGARVDLTVAKADSPDPVQVGMPLTYTVTVGNEGPGDDPLVTVTDQLPPDSDERFLSAETTQGRCRERRGVVTCDLGSLAVGATATVTIVVRPIGDTNVLLNTARVLGANIDQNPGNNADTEETAVRTGGP
jgi:uncharacterized delta-60 repeat protein/uncharacterized repeat protein (TIGR01451 family)